MTAPAKHSRLATIVCLSLGLITLLLYLPTLRHEFIAYDDQQYVTENPQVQAGLTWSGLLWSFGYHAGNWHPLTWLSHMLDCQLYGLNPAGHHLTHVLLHVANTILLFWMLLRMTGATWRSACVAALFGWHPLHVESVAWVAERKDVLSTFFGLLALLSHAQYARRSEITPPGRNKWYYLLLLSFALALMSKPMAVTLPLVLLLLDYWPLGRFSGRESVRQLLGLVYEKIPLVIMSIAVCGLTVSAQEQAIATTAGLSISHRFVHALVAYAHYLTATFLPINLAVFYPYDRALPVVQILFAALLLLSMTIVGIRLRNRQPYFLIGWLWFLGTLVPVIGIVQVGDQAWADRYTYIPLIGVFVMLAWGIAALVKSRRVNAGLACGVGLTLLSLTSVQLRHWQSTKTLFTHTATVTRNNHMAITMLGSLMAREGNLPGAIANYRQALAIQPGFPEAHFLLGNALDQQGQLDEAIAEYRQAVWFQPLRETTLTLMGIALGKKKEFALAAAHLHEAIKINPKSAVAYNSLARLYHVQGFLDAASTNYSQALRLDPLLPQAHNNLGVVLLQKGQLPEAIATLRESVRLNPTNSESKLNLALALNQNQQWEGAAEVFREVVQPQLNDPNLHYQFGIALEHLSKTREAVAQFAQALLLQADFPAALDRLAWILSTSRLDAIRNGPQALGMAQRACSLTGQAEPKYQITLAAAFAENGDFDSALGILNQLGGPARTNLTTDWQAMARSFANRQPWRSP